MNSGRWTLVNKLFLKAAELPPDDRAAHLDAACGDDRELRAEVEQLLSGDSELDASFLEPVTEFPLHELSGDDPLIGRRISHYAIQSLLGTGGMGRVYLAARVEDYTEQVVIKFLRRELAGKEMLRRFRNEMKIQAALGGHPNIARLLDAGVTDDQRPFLVMEYVDGKEIQRYCDECSLAVRARLQLFLGVCEAVQFAHQHGVIHRDLKPSNILVTKEGSPKLIDFGIAKLLDQEEATYQTQTAYRALTPDYASPEHIQGKHLTTASDVYSLGVVLFELLTGHRPYRLTARSAAEVERIVCEREPIRPSSAVVSVEPVHTADEASTPNASDSTHRWLGQSLQILRRQLTGDLDNIVLKALRKEPQHRYQSAQSLAEDIERHLLGLPVSAQRPTWRYRAGKFVRRNMAGVVAAGLVVLSLVVGIAGTTWQWRRAEDEATSARLASRDARQNEQLALLQVYRANIALAAAELERGNASATRLWLDECSKELRNWEWRYFDRQLMGGQVVLTGHADRVSQGVFLNAGSQLATASWDGTVRIWNVADGRELSVLRDGTARIGNLVGSADGRLLATASHDGVVRIWDVKKKSIATRIAARGYINFSSDGLFLACASKGDKKIRLWDASSGALYAELPNAPAVASLAIFSSDGAQLAYSSSSGVVLWDVAAKKEIVELRDSHAPTYPMAFSPDAQRIVTCSGEPALHVKLWNAHTGKLIAELGQHSRDIRHASFSADGALFVTASNDSTLRISNGVTGQQVSVLHGHLAPVVWTAFAPDGSYLASCSDDATVRLWDPPTGRPIRVLTGHGGYVHSLLFAPDSRRLASCSFDHTARIWDITALEPAVCRGHRGIVMATACSPDGTAIASGSLDGTVRIWDVETATQIAVFGNEELINQRQSKKSHPTASVLAVAYSPDGSSVAAVRRDGRLDVWNIETGERSGNNDRASNAEWRAGVVFTSDSKRVIHQRTDGAITLWNIHDGKSDTLCELPPNSVRSLALAPDGRRLALGLASGQAVVWDLASASERASFEHEAGVIVVRFSPDGRLLASGGDDQQVRVWDLEANEQIAALPVSATVYALAFSPDGTRLAIGSAEEEIQLCDTSAWSIVAQLSGHDQDVNSLEFSADGMRLISGSSDYTVRIWDAGLDNE